METKDDVLKELLRPLIEELVSNSLNAWLAVHPGVTEESVRNIMKEEKDIAHNQRRAIAEQQRLDLEMMKQTFGEEMVKKHAEKKESLRSIYERWKNANEY